MKRLGPVCGPSRANVCFIFLLFLGDTSEDVKSDAWLGVSVLSAGHNGYVLVSYQVSVTFGEMY